MLKFFSLEGNITSLHVDMHGGVFGNNASLEQLDDAY